MLKLEKIIPHSIIKGVLSDVPVEVVSVRWYGTEAIELTFKSPDGYVSNQILYRQDESHLDLVTAEKVWGFDGDGDAFIQASEAQRIKLAYLYDPLLAVHSSNIEPLPHQITAVYEIMLNRQPLRFLLADDPGAGKTIMAGLLIRELIARGEVERCLIVCPGNLAEQWQDELFSRFHLKFAILTNEGFQASVSNWFLEHDLAIARLDKLARDDELEAKLNAPDCHYDLIVCDEAHKMSASYFGGEVKYTKRYQLGRLLSGITRNFLLMTATPHNGKEQDFQLFMALLDPDRFEGRFRSGVYKTDVSDLMRRMVKEQLLKFDGTPLFPPRIAHSLPFELSDMEADLYAEVTRYVRTQFNRAEAIQNGKRTSTIGFALTVLQRRLASSPEAIYQSLQRRHQRLESKLKEWEAMQRNGSMPSQQDLSDQDIEDLDDAPDEEVEQVEEQVLDDATAATSIAELKEEIETLRGLEAMAYKVRMSGTDTKWRQLSGLIQELFARPSADSSGFPAEGEQFRQAEPGYGAGEIEPPTPSPYEKIVIFTEHRDTLNYLKSKISTLLGKEDAIVVIHGGLSRDERRRAEAAFKNDPHVQILLATDAAGEGINLQRAHLMVNYDLPWNPNRIEQRFGRIHRIGQTKICYLWNLVALKTREGDVYHTLLIKLEEARKALGGRVFDVLGKLQFEGRSLRELLIQAIREGDNPAAKACIDKSITEALDMESLSNLLEEKALVRDVMDTTRVARIREDMERADARRLQPYYIKRFFIKAFKDLGGSIYEREQGRFEITHVPPCLRTANRTMGTRNVVLPRYQRVTFEKDLIHPEGSIEAELLCPSAPLLEAVLDLTLEHKANVLKQGTVLVDENDEGTNPAVVFFLEHSLQDASTTATGARHVISKRILYVRITEDGVVQHLDYAPYLDLRQLKESEPSVGEILSQTACAWIDKDLEQKVMEYAVTHVAQGHLSEVRAEKLKLLEKTEQEVKNRLSKEINYWDRKAAELKEQEAAGKPAAKLNSGEARRRADELQNRLQRRLASIQREKEISSLPPVIHGSYLVVPIGLLRLMQGLPPVTSTHPVNTQENAAKARAIVMERERELGYEPVDREFDKIGYDIESRIPGTGRLRMIEVKGRMAGEDYITVTANEILYSLNKPDSYILAIVLFSADGKSYSLHYVEQPFGQEPDIGENTRNYDIATLLANGRVQKQINTQR